MNLLPLLKYWPLALALLTGFSSWTIKGRLDHVALVEALHEKDEDIAAISQATEDQLLTERQNTAMLAKKWSAARASTTHSHCKLDTDSIQLLKDASSGVSR